MQIVLGATTLCHGALRGIDQSTGPANLVVAAENAAQVVAPVRAAFVKVIDRGGRASSISFDVARQCASENAAGTFAALHPATVAASGDLVITTGAGSVKMEDAHIRNVRCAQVGATVLIAYQIQGGKLETVTP